ncbi:hypothetical protein BD770DRAFT_395459 [Pilaira anomala]|nr:hypothetical protein BD770DRAFT_395459 [Pilaira anomala]
MMGSCYLSLGNAANLVLSSQMITTNKNHRINTTKVNITTYQNTKQATRESETNTKSPPVEKKLDTFYSFPDTPPASEIEETYSEEARSSIDQEEQDELYDSSTTTTTTDEALSENEFSLGKNEVLSEEELSFDEKEEYNNKGANSNNRNRIKTVNSTIHTNNLITKHDTSPPPPPPSPPTPSPSPPLITSQKKILSFAKLIFSLKRPTVLRHDFTFVTGAIQYEIIKSHINIGFLTQSQLSGIITKSDFISFMVTYRRQKGRWIFVMKKQYRDLIAEEFNASLCN